MKSKFSKEDFQNKLNSLYGNMYTILSDFVDTQTKISIKCNICGNIFETVPNEITRSRNIKKNTEGCIECRKQKEFKDKVKKMYGEEYNVLTKYTKGSDKIKVRHNCEYCNNSEWEIRAITFLKESDISKCPYCNGNNKNDYIFKNEVKKLVGDEYTFLESYINSTKPILCRHEKCKHEWYIKPNNFTNGGIRCPKCANNLEYDDKEFRRRLFNIVGDEYSILEDYTGCHNKILFKHNTCGHEWHVKPNDFLNRGTRCPVCSTVNKRKTNEEFKKELYDIVGDEYTTLSEYIRNSDKIKIRHNACGHIYEVRPNDILSNGNRCPKCSASIISREETEVLDFISSIYKGDVSTNNRKILDGQELDIYIPDLKIAIEYDGLYWHGEDKKPNDYHINKTLECNKRGINLIHIFEDEWLFKQELVKKELTRLLSNGRHFEYTDYIIEEVKDISKVDKFLSKNHLLGHSYKTNFALRIKVDSKTLGIISGRLFNTCIFLDRLLTNFDDREILEIFIKYIKDKYKLNTIFFSMDNRWLIKDKYEYLEEYKLLKPKYWYYNKKKRYSKEETPNTQSYSKIYDCGSTIFIYK